MMARNNNLRVGVVGVGYLGYFHAQKYAVQPSVKLVGVVDVDSTRATEVAVACHTQASADYRDLFGQVDCVSIAVPTQLHHVVARDFLTRGIDVLVEKPLTATAAEGRELVELAAHHHCILQVGHLERFNPALRSLAGILTAPRFIECHRVAPFVERGTDVDVVRDLMIHDLDVILSLVRSSVASMEAFGVPVLTAEPDIANARLRFASGCIANITASRVALKRERKMRIFQPDTYLVVDYGEQRIRICRREPGSQPGGLPNLTYEEREVGGEDALEEEIRAFLRAVRERSEPVVSGHDGLQALEVAEQIIGCLEIP
ncbi:MAG TPA: Gfo/Idh/MocA family oxidoreductase [Candidatus Binatia bacterium]|nr:Gfo/Idh/MocA family oxidoreductase [Candidatus Binatia bacterium]